MSPDTATSRGINAGDWVGISTPLGKVRARARLVSNIANGVVAAQHGWWQACPELGLPAYDAFGPMSANINLVIGSSATDTVSGVAPLRAYYCDVEKLDPKSVDVVDAER
jgi:anaerobic selenocysteine-containing dehydrogenase